MPVSYTHLDVYKRQIELAIVPGGAAKGSVWIDELTMEEREPAHAYSQNPTIGASTTAEGYTPEGILNPDPVSYTHLDVYKRKILLRNIFFSFIRIKKGGHYRLLW